MKLSLLFLCLTSCTKYEYSWEYHYTDKVVVEIGGCGGYRLVTCAVRLNDGSRGLMERPMLGDKYYTTEYVKKEIK